MPDWLKWKKVKLRKPKTVEPVPFEINCVCGRLAAGKRVPRYQQVICLDCGEPLFVLPLNPYPAPLAGSDQPAAVAADSPEAKTAPRPKSKSGAAGDDDPTVKPEGETSEASAAAANSKSTKSKPNQKTKPQGKSKSPRKPDAVPLSKMKRPTKRRITPFRITLLAIGGILAATIFYTVKSSRVDNAQVVMRDAAAGGFEALAEDNILGAAIEFRKAAEAATLVAPDSTQAATLKQMQNEAEVVTRLSDESIIDVIMRAVTAKELQPTDWQESFTLSEDWIVFDSHVKKSVGLDGSEVAIVEFPISVNDTHVTLQCLPDAFGPMTVTDKFERIIFAARIQSIDYQTTPAQWQLVLDSTDVVLCTNEQLFAAAGFKTDKSQWDTQTAPQLAKQKQAMGINE